MNGPTLSAMRRYAILRAPHGSVGIVAAGRALCSVILTRCRGRDAGALVRRSFPDAEHEADLFPVLRRQLGYYFAGRRVRFRVKLDLSSLTPFQRQVLEACARIDYGATATYGELARGLGRPAAARAVGQALARNPIPLVIPCHRVVAADGSLGGFSAEQGVSLKRFLLELESRAQPE